MDYQEISLAGLILEVTVQGSGGAKDLQLAMPDKRQGFMRRHIAAVTLGNALEFYDFLTFSFFAIQIGHAFFPSNSAYGSLMGSLATFGAGFAMRPLGAIVIGRYADRVGRKPAMLLSFVLIGASIFGMALIPTYAAIGFAAPVLAVISRMLQGFSLGGEIGSNTSYPPRDRSLDSHRSRRSGSSAKGFSP